MGFMSYKEYNNIILLYSLYQFLMRFKKLNT